MEQPFEYIGLLVTFVLAVTIAGLILFLNKLLGPKHPQSASKLEPFECGVAPSQTPKQFSVKFYLLAMFFILFDVEVVWLFPWAVILRELGVAGLVEMFSFIAVLVLGFVYALRKGALEWEK